MEPATDRRETVKTPHLDQVASPYDLRRLTDIQLREVADELRAETIRVVSETGGHLGSSLAVVELTVALHAIFQTPLDRLIWDVGHQTYPHKILTGRRDRIRTLRQGGGLAGFTSRSESEFDAFGAGHSSTSISAGLGMAVARDLRSSAGATDKNHVICAIGDGAMSAGMAYEALNNAGAIGARLVIILNDNEMSISHPVGALSTYLAGLVADTPIRSRHDQRGRAEAIPKSSQASAQQRPLGPARHEIPNRTMFEDLGIRYVGPVDGHDLDALLSVLRDVRDARDEGPVLVHAVTRKGFGYPAAERSAEKLHAVSPFNMVTGEQEKTAPAPRKYQDVFADTLIAEAERDESIVAITAAMPSGTSLDRFGERFPDRYFDVGIAEQHAVTFAAGLAAEGLRPWCAIYSTFLQRAYDQVVHDVAIQRLPVRFAIDRAGLVGADGATHAGSFDIAYLGCLPGMVLMAPADEGELVRMIRTALLIDDGPSAIRYPRGASTGASAQSSDALEIGVGRILREGNALALVAVGTRLAAALAAAEQLDSYGLSPTVADARFIKPLDHLMIERLAREHEVLITVEEGSAGGFGAAVMHHLAWRGLLDGNLKFRPMTLPDEFIEHDTPARQMERAGLTAMDIVATALSCFQRTAEMTAERV